ncbi:MAG: response regulator transcription factor [Anaerolineae bacterium]|nr:response regulator transcription factor [Anaerolineae bacterium]
MSNARVLLIGRSQVKGSAFPASLKKRYQLTIVPNGKQAELLAARQKPHVIVLDAVSLRTPGDRMCQSLRQKLPDIPIVHIHPGSAQNKGSPADTILFQPFSSRKLINCIERLITLSDDEVLICGPLTLNIPRRTLATPQQETQLTPKVALLLELFMRQPNQTLDRKALMEKVWHTDYMGDTRTLDVHIRWIRQAIETNPGKPQYLKTVRGVGYCLDIPANGKH